MPGFTLLHQFNPDGTQAVLMLDPFLLNFGMTESYVTADKQENVPRPVARYALSERADFCRHIALLNDPFRPAESCYTTILRATHFCVWTSEELTGKVIPTPIQPPPNQGDKHAKSTNRNA
jgi:hypothetical protein